MGIDFIAMKKKSYKPTPRERTIIDMIWEADFAGVKAEVAKDPSVLTKQFYFKKDTFFNGTVLHAGYIPMNKWRPIKGALDAIKIHKWLLEQPGIDAAQPDQIGMTPRQLYKQWQYIVLMEDRIHSHNSAKEERKRQQAEAEKLKTQPQRRKMAFQAKHKIGQMLDKSADLIPNIICYATALIFPMAIYSRIRIIGMLKQAEQRNAQVAAPH